jgi:DNA modification methylase
VQTPLLTVQVTIQGFGNPWNWAGAAEAWAEFADLCPVPKVIELMRGFHNTLGENDVMAYLVMMAPRLYHLWRVLKPTGSLYLHCDPTASAYLKLILDGIFGAKNFKNEIIWRRYGTHNDTGQGSRHFGRVHDTIYYYTKGPNAVWNQVYMPLRPEYIEQTYRLEDPGTGRRFMTTPLTGPGGAEKGNPVFDWKGHTRAWRYSRETMERLEKEGRLYYSSTGYVRQKKYIDESKGIPVQDEWTDIGSLSGAHSERLGYPTQKPIALLERIINASSNPGDVVLDPFCGCGTAIVAAQKLGRQWLGIDVTPIATSLIQKRLFDQFEARDLRLLSPADRANSVTLARAFNVEGLPTDEAGARAMFEADHKKFEMWAVGLVPAIPQEKKGADGGIDGLAYFDVGAKELTKAVIQVKGGKNVGSPGVQQLRGAMSGMNAALGFYVTLEPPTKNMKAEALSAGYYKAATGVGRQVPAMQIRTVAELLSGQGFDFPVTVGSNVSFKSASAIAAASGQGGLGL